MGLNRLMMGGSDNKYTHLITVGENQIDDNILAYGYGTTTIVGVDMGAITPTKLDNNTILAVYVVDFSHYGQLYWAIVLSGVTVRATIELTYGQYTIELEYGDYNIQTKATSYTLSVAGGDDSYETAYNILNAFVTGKTIPVTIKIAR